MEKEKQQFAQYFEEFTTVGVDSAILWDNYATNVKQLSEKDKQKFVATMNKACKDVRDDPVAQ